MEQEFESLNQDGQLNFERFKNDLVSEASNVAAPQYATDFIPHQSQQVHCQYQGQETHSSNHQFSQSRTYQDGQHQAFDQLYHENNSQDVQQRSQSPFDNSITDNNHTAQISPTSERIQKRQNLKRKQRERHNDRMSKSFEKLRRLITSEQKSRQEILDLAIRKIRFLSR